MIQSNAVIMVMRIFLFQCYTQSLRLYKQFYNIITESSVVKGWNKPKDSVTYKALPYHQLTFCRNEFWSS